MLLVEGAGGLLVPLHRGTTTETGRTMADLAWDLGEEVETQVVIVTRPTLGTLNHTALTLEATWSRDLRVAGLVVCGWPQEGDVDLVARTNLRELAEMAPILGMVGVCDGLDTARPGPVELPFLAVPADGG
jgi:dethiobiotin synthetase